MESVTEIVRTATNHLLEIDDEPDPHVIVESASRTSRLLACASTFEVTRQFTDASRGGKNAAVALLQAHFSHGAKFLDIVEKLPVAARLMV
jgi:hypothetical protein